MNHLQHTSVYVSRVRDIKILIRSTEMERDNKNIFAGQSG